MITLLINPALQESCLLNRTVHDSVMRTSPHSSDTSARAAHLPKVAAQTAPEKSTGLI